MSRIYNNPPNARALMNGARSMGSYDLAASLADLIDNSITAEAKTVWIECNFNDGIPVITIKDDGFGMFEEELIEAMRPASVDPDMERTDKDLGRFGWGMKSASLSQSKALSVLTRKNGQLSGAEWDLDNIDDWSMTLYDDEEILDLLKEYAVKLDVITGTIIIWRNCDRLSDGGEIGLTDFNHLITEARDKLSLIFHRFLDNKSSNSLKILINNTEIKGHDPFFEDHPATQAQLEEKITISGCGVVKVTPYILPHFSKLTPKEIKNVERVEGSNRNQGFYVFRNDRLIISGTWFGIFKHSDLSDLIRVKIDIPNTMDKFWKISIDKNDAKLPATLKKRLKDILRKIRGSSVRVYQYKGRKLQEREKDPVWVRLKKAGKVRFEIDRQMSIIETFSSSMSSDQEEGFNSILSLIEQSIPLSQIIADTSSSEAEIIQAATEPQSIVEDIRVLLPMIVEKLDGTVEEKIEKICDMTFFADHKKLVKSFMEEFDGKY